MISLNVSRAKPSQYWLTTALLCTPLLLWLCGKAANDAGYRFNFTRSMPIGFYKLTPANATSVQHLSKGSLIEFCPPSWVTPVRFPFYALDRELRCEGGGMPLIKRVVAVEGDVVRVNERAVSINGLELLQSAQKPLKNLETQEITRTLGAGELWAYGEGDSPSMAAHSFDSRYFGVVPASNVLAFKIESSSHF